MKQTLKKAGIDKPSSVTKLTITGILEDDDCLFIREKMSKTLQELDLSMALVINKTNLDFADCTCLTSVIIPDSITIIDHWAFRNCTHLTSIIIPDSVTMICDGAFCNCTHLASIIIPDSVSKICDYAFKGCSSLSSVNIPNSVVRIGYCAFMDCTSLTSVTIPSSVIHIGDLAFHDCPASFTVHPDNPVYQSDHGKIRQSLCRELEQQIIARWSSNGKKVDEKLKELLSIRKERINSAFTWTPETKARLLHLNAEFIRCFEILRDESFPYLKALQNIVDEKDMFRNNFKVEAKVYVKIYTPDCAGILQKPDDGIESILINTLPEKILTMHIAEYKEEMNEEVYLNKKFNWYNKLPLKGAFDEHYISYAIRELYVHTYFSIQDILKINRLHVEFRVLHHTIV